MFKPMKFGYLMGILILSMALLLAACGARSSGTEAQNGQPGDIKMTSWSKMPEMSIDLDKSYRAVVETSMGSFGIKLFADEAPSTVNNFVFLANEGFYENLTFHNIIDSFMIQAGDPLGNGTGNAGYRIPDELDAGAIYREGTVAMFNTGVPNSGSSQFFICTGPDAANLNRQPDYTIFGEIDAGMDVVREIAGVPTENGKPLEDIVILSVSIEVADQ